MMLTTLLAKGIADLTFGGAFLWYLVKFIISAVVAFAGIMLGITLRKKKNAKQQPLSETAGTKAEQKVSKITFFGCSEILEMQ